MHRIIKKIVLVLLVVFIAIQFIRPARNVSYQILLADISKLVKIPDSVQVLLKNACYDCHSNNTNYPWYATIQPMGWLMANHIKEGKAVLNFSEFGNYKRRRQISKLKDMANQIKDGEMPISSYKILHKNASLTQAEKTLIMDLMNKTADSLSSGN